MIHFFCRSSPLLRRNSIFILRGKKPGKKKAKIEIPPGLTVVKIAEMWGNYRYGRKVDFSKFVYDESKVPAWLMDKVENPRAALVPFNELDPEIHGAKYVARRLRRAEIKRQNALLKAGDYKRSKVTNKKRGLWFPKGTVS